jgi:predicted  nucleic acid-binding Zn-ribbon protein
VSTTLAVEILLALLATGLSAAAFFAATRANRAQADAAESAVDAAAYQRAKDIYESAIDSLKGQTRDLHDQVVNLQTEVSRLRLQSADLQTEVVQLRGSNADLRRHITILEGRQDGTA